MITDKEEHEETTNQEEDENKNREKEDKPHTRIAIEDAPGRCFMRLEESNIRLMFFKHDRLIWQLSFGGKSDKLM